MFNKINVFVERFRYIVPQIITRKYFYQKHEFIVEFKPPF